MQTGSLLSGKWQTAKLSESVTRYMASPTFLCLLIPNYAEVETPLAKVVESFSCFYVTLSHT